MNRPDKIQHLNFACTDPENASYPGYFDTLKVGGFGKRLMLCLHGRRTKLVYVAIKHGIVTRYKLNVGKRSIPCRRELEGIGGGPWNCYRTDLFSVVQVLSYLRQRGFEAEEGDTEIVELWAQRDLKDRDIRQAQRDPADESIMSLLLPHG
jgi:hypothetical protein